MTNERFRFSEIRRTPEDPVRTFDELVGLAVAATVTVVDLGIFSEIDRRTAYDTTPRGEQPVRIQALESTATKSELTTPTDIDLERALLETLSRDAYDLAA